MKKCNNCGETKSIERFARQSYAIDGHYATCKDCRKSGNTKLASKERKRLSDAGHARCTACKQIKVLPEFYVNRSSSNGRNSTCKICHHDSLVRHARKRKTGFTDIEYETKLAEQGSACAICGSKNKNGNALSADHCHKTGTKRGLLCSPCNLGLGSFQDDPARLAAAIKYLGRYSDEGIE